MAIFRLVQVLLIADVLVGAQKKIVTGFFSALDQDPIPQLVPALLRGSYYLMSDKASGKITEEFDVSLDQIQAVLHFASQSLAKKPMLVLLSRFILQTRS